MEKLILCHISALEAWDRGLCSREGLSRTEALSGFAPSATDLHQLEIDSLQLHRPIHFYTSDDALRHRTRELHAHWKATPSPPMTLAHIDGTTFASTPEECYLQLAPDLDIIGTTRLGMELCGSHSTLTFGRQGFLNRAPLTDSGTLAQLVRRRYGGRSRSHALQALRWITDGSASPVDTALYLLLVLPHRMGGYGLPQPQMSFRFDLKDSGRYVGSCGSCRCDYLWPDAHTMLAYNGSQEHPGLNVIVMTRRQLRSAKDTHVIALRIARRLGHRMRLPDRFEEKNTLLRRRLFSWGCGVYDRWIPYQPAGLETRRLERGGA